MRPSRCVASVCGLGLVFAGCISREVSSTGPTTKTVFQAVIAEGAVKRLDLLFVIDNSGSMGDKQDYLSRAVPDLISRLVSPYCVDPNDTTKFVGQSMNGQCASGQLEFPPVHDMHIGIVSSSLGKRGGDLCDPNPSQGTPNPHDDDQAHLLNRTGNADAPTGLLGWFPNVTANDGESPTSGVPPVTDANTLVGDFQDMVAKTGQDGCGIESQLESWYRFLAQPDPYDSIAVQNGAAQWQGYDAALLKQRHDFLRPDSLLAIVDLTDENDSEIDVRSYPGTPVAGHVMMQSQTGPIRGTSACMTNPMDPACTSCAASGTSGDPECQKGRYDPNNDPQGFSNVRHVHMKQSYGLDFQYPIGRYVQALTKNKVPDRRSEYPSGAQTYKGLDPKAATCTNPIFAQNLPDGSNTDPDALCNLQVGSRKPDLVYYAHIGGVPADLLHFDPTDPQAGALSDADWQKILGNDPTTYDFTGMDPRMAENFRMRLIGGASTWDLDYACTFDLATPRDCTNNPECFDCPTTAMSPDPSKWPLCDPNDPTKQTKAKAYPTVRELLLAKLLGSQGVVSSICPIHVTEQGAGDPLYGYRPAVRAIVDRLKASLVGQCLPHQIVPDTQGAVPCLVIASLANTSQTCDPGKGLAPLDAATLAQLQTSLAGQSNADALDTAQHTVCAVSQLSGGDLSGGKCTSSSKAGWCYQSGSASGACAQEIIFSPSGQPTTGTQVLLSCIEQAR
jgi:hypothetical protein